MFRDPHLRSPIPVRPEPPGSPGTGLPPEAPLVSTHAALVFLIAVVFGSIMGGLMFLDDGSAPAAIATGLGCFGVSVPVLHKLIG